ncbi:MAG: hypothetical protein ACR2LZ_06400 [Pyrinomonadaceae bacterium]
MRYITRKLLSGYLRATVYLLVIAHCLLPSAYSLTSDHRSLPTAQESSYAVIISGASGEENYAKQFAEWSESLRRALVEELNFAPEKIRMLSEKPSNGAVRATAEEVRRAFESLRVEATPESIVFVFLIGHGTFDGANAKFNLVGPDLPATAYDSLISALPARRVVVINTASASGEFIKPLAGKGRVIVTATKSGQERNATRFAGYFIEALTNPAADADQNKRVSVLEAFSYAAKLTDEMYKSAGRLATEHALLEDSGDGVGHPSLEAGDGALARTTYFNVPIATPAGGDNRAAKVLAERTRLEEEIEQLKARKSQMPVSDYEATLEKLLIELAKLNQANKQKQ